MYWIGMDVGSTCTKAVALDEGGNLVFYKVTPTGWNCVETASALMEAMATQGVCRQDARVVATGYGRVSIPFADKAVTEISCHGKGAAWLFGADAYLDIGCSVMSPNRRRMETLPKLMEEFDVEGVIDVTLQTCTTYMIETRAVRKLCEGLHIPYMSMETDYSQEDGGQIETRIAAFIETLC